MPFSDACLKILAGMGTSHFDRRQDLRLEGHFRGIHSVSFKAITLDDEPFSLFTTASKPHLGVTNSRSGFLRGFSAGRFCH